MSEPMMTAYRDLLLDRIDEEARQELERKILGSETAFQAALAEEAELCDAYARGELSPFERAAFDRKLRESERLRSRVAFADALQEVGSLQPGFLPRASPPSRAFGRWGVGLLAASIGGLAVSVLLWTQLPERSPGDPNRVATLYVASDVLRGAGDLREHLVPRDAEWIQLQLELLEPRESATYQVDLYGPDGEHLWTGRKLTPHSFDWGTAIVAEIPLDEISLGPVRAELLEVGGELVGYYELELRYSD